MKAESDSWLLFSKIDTAFAEGGKYVLISFSDEEGSSQRIVVPREGGLRGLIANLMQLEANMRGSAVMDTLSAKESVLSEIHRNREAIPTRVVSGFGLAQSTSGGVFLDIRTVEGEKFRFGLTPTGAGQLAKALTGELQPDQPKMNA